MLLQYLQANKHLGNKFLLFIYRQQKRQNPSETAFFQLNQKLPIQLCGIKLTKIPDKNITGDSLNKTRFLNMERNILKISNKWYALLFFVPLKLRHAVCHLH